MKKDTIKKFIKALDQCEFEAAYQFMANDCQFVHEDQLTKGADNIIHMFQKNHEWAKKHLDKIQYRSEVNEENGKIKALLYDDIEINHSKMIYTSQKIFEYGQDGKITKIIYKVDKKEKERLKDFFNKNGLKK